MAKTRIGANAIFSGPQKGLTTIGEHCYAYSGAVSNDGGNETTLLEFNTGKGYIKGIIQTGTSHTGDHADTFRFRVYFNGQVVYDFLDDAGQYYVDPHIPIRIIIPPLTLVKVTGDNTASTAVKIIEANVIGRVYDA